MGLFELQTNDFEDIVFTEIDLRTIKEIKGWRNRKNMINLSMSILFFVKK